jgi:hypothetical protein
MCRVPHLNDYEYWFIRFPVADADVEEPRFVSRSWRKVCKSELVVDVLEVLEVLLDEVPSEAALSAETRLLKSDLSVLSALSVEEVEEAEEVEADVDEVEEEALNSEISCCKPVVKLE